jgi:hypothetical protein
MLKELGKVDNILGFDNNVTNICNNRTIVLMVMKLALLLVMVAVELMYFSFDCYKLVVLVHCHWTLNFARLEVNILELVVL